MFSGKRTLQQHLNQEKQCPLCQEIVYIRTRPTWHNIPCSLHSNLHGHTQHLPWGYKLWRCNMGSCIPGMKTELLTTCEPDHHSGVHLIASPPQIKTFRSEECTSCLERFPPCLPWPLRQGDILTGGHMFWIWDLSKEECVWLNVQCKGKAVIVRKRNLRSWRGRHLM